MRANPARRLGRHTPRPISTTRKTWRPGCELTTTSVNEFCAGGGGHDDRNLTTTTPDLASLSFTRMIDNTPGQSKQARARRQSPPTHPHLPRTHTHTHTHIRAVAHPVAVHAHARPRGASSMPAWARPATACAADTAFPGSCSSCNPLSCESSAPTCPDCTGERRQRPAPEDCRRRDQGWPAR